MYALNIAGMGKRSRLAARPLRHRNSSPMRPRDFVPRLRKQEVVDDPRLRKQELEEQPQPAVPRQPRPTVPRQPEREEIVAKGFLTRRESFQNSDRILADRILALIRAG